MWKPPADTALNLPGRNSQLAVAVGTPALDCPVDAQPASVLTASGDRNESANRHSRLAVGVVTPAENGPVDLQSANMAGAGGDCGEAPFGRAGRSGRGPGPNRRRSRWLATRSCGRSRR